SSQALEVQDTRVNGGAVFLKRLLLFSHHVFFPGSSPTHVAVDWWQIDPAKLALLQFGGIEEPTRATHYFYSSFSANSLGDALLGYCESGTYNYASSSYCYHSHTDAAGVMENNYIAKAGLASYYKTAGTTRNRYGDFTGTCVDAADNSFWNFSEWANT